MTTQQLEQKFSLIGDPIVRAVVRHLYDPKYNDALYFAETAANVAYWAADWEKFKLDTFSIPENLVDNCNYSFTPEELKQVQNAYPELFNADGSLKADSSKTTHDTDAPRICDELQVGSPAIKPELNRNEIALKIYIALNGNANTQYVTTEFDELAKISYQAADAFIKHSHESNNNK